MGKLPNSPPGDAVNSAEREEDAQLARRAGNGEAEAFGVLYDRYVDAVYRYVFYRVRNEAEAEDVTSDVFMRALRAIPKYEPRQAFLAWLYRIARNAVIDRSRRRAARQQVTFEDALAHPHGDNVVNPDEGLLAGSDASAVRAAMRELTPLQQEVLVLRYVEGLDTKSISKITGKRDGTIRGIEFRALSALRTMIPSREHL
ncbi:MAG TPA: sigma-70 family RNA polymerase sigma factor [Candidatus Limnocylindria bacterium]